MDNKIRDKNKGDCGSNIKKDNEHLAFIKMKSVKNAKDNEIKVEFVHPTAAQDIFKQQIVDKFEGEFAADEKPEFDEFPGSAVDDTLEIHGSLSQDGVTIDDDNLIKVDSEKEIEKDSIQTEQSLSDIEEKQEEEEESHAKPFIVYPVIKNGRQVNRTDSENQTTLFENQADLQDTEAKLQADLQETEAELQTEQIEHNTCENVTQTNSDYQYLKDNEVKVENRFEDGEAEFVQPIDKSNLENTENKESFLSDLGYKENIEVAEQSSGEEIFDESEQSQTKAIVNCGCGKDYEEGLSDGICGGTAVSQSDSQKNIIIENKESDNGGQIMSAEIKEDSKKAEKGSADNAVDEFVNLIKDDKEELSLLTEKKDFENTDSISEYGNDNLYNVNREDIRTEALGSDIGNTETDSIVNEEDSFDGYFKEIGEKSYCENVNIEKGDDNDISFAENISTKEDKTMKVNSELKLKVKPENLISADKLLIVKRNSIKEEAEMSESAIKEKAKAVKDYKSKKGTNTITDIKDKTEQNEKKFKVLFVSPEVAPFIHTGGLGEVSYALPVALAEKNVDIRVILPLYSAISEEYKKRMKYIGNTYVNLAWRYQYAGVFELKKDGVIYYFIDNEFYFKRDGIYGHFDDGERFAFFSKAVLELLRVIDFYPDVIHSNDWQSALVPVFLDAFYRGIEEYKNIRTLFTIHNIQYQGKYDKEVVRDILGLGSRANWVMMDNCCNYMKGAIECAKAVSTVSKAYVGEIMDPYFSYGLDSILRERSYKISGILNGIDNNIFNPETDKKIIKNYNYETIQYKKDNKKALLEKIGLQYDENRPLISMVSRLTEQKGIDLLLATADKILSADLQLVILGKGDWKYEKAISDIQYRYSNKVRAIIDFSDEMARQIYAGSDIFLMPSKYEPCGLSQMISMRYGTVPIVRETGGLKDSVVPFNITDKSGTGFTFYSYNSYDMLDAIWRAFATYFDKDSWSALIKNIMSADFGWDKQSEEYLNLYKSL